MRSAALFLALLGGAWTAPLTARDAVEASDPTALAVTLYRDPNRGTHDAMNRDWPQGFAMITEKRTVTLPPGESTIRFTGVAEGMIAVSAIVTGLPGGTIEKNRNADLLSPASLIDGTLGNRVTVTRTNPATGEQVAEDAVVRTRADGGLVLQTSQGFEAVRCSGLPEKLTFERVPAGLSAQPVYSVDTRDRSGGTYTVELTYLAWGFDWQAHYVATLAEPGRNDEVKLRLMSWLTLLNDNGQSFPDAELMVVAGKLNVESDYRTLADPPDAEAFADQVVRRGDLFLGGNQKRQRLVGRDHCLEVGGAAGHQLQQRVDADIGHLAITRLQCRKRRGRLLHADEFEFHAFALEIAQVDRKIHDRVRHQRRLEIRDNETERLSQGCGARARHHRRRRQNSDCQFA